MKNCINLFKNLELRFFTILIQLSGGDDWACKIQDGLAKCRYGVIVISNNFYDREWTEKELKSLLVRQNDNGENVILPILYNTNIDELKKHCKRGCYKDLAKIQFINKEEVDVKDITILLARKLLKDSRIANSTVQKSKDNKAMFDNFLKKTIVLIFIDGLTV